MEINLNSKEDLKIYSNPINYKDTPLSYLFNKTFKILDYTGTLIMDDGSDPYTNKESPIYDFDMGIKSIRNRIKDIIVCFKEVGKNIEMYEPEKQTLIARISQENKSLDQYVTITKEFDQLHLRIDNEKVNTIYHSYNTFILKEIDAL